MPTACWGNSKVDEMPGARSQFPLEGFVEDGGEHGVQLGGGSGLESFHGIDFCLQGIEFGSHLMLL